MNNEEEVPEGPKFSPPVYMQRYETMVKLINQGDCKKVLDMGCSEAKLLTHIKIHCKNVEEIIGVDIDIETILANRFRTKPLMSEYLKKRNTPLKMAIYQGSAATPDCSFKNFDFITCVEVIEHLHKEELAAFPASIFGVLQPEVIAITTPNADFNVLFPNMVGFRHPDHKFEWTRKEFEAWCTTCCQRYGYSAEFSFIGFGPDGTEYLGGCTQMAVFRKIPDHALDSSLLENVTFGTYKLISEHVYPYEPPKSIEESLAAELKYLVSKHTRNQYEENDYSEYTTRRVSLQTLIKSPSIKEICGDTELIRNIASDMFEMTEDEQEIIVQIEEEDDGRYFDDKFDYDYDDDFVETIKKEYPLHDNDSSLTVEVIPEECWD